VIYVSHTKQDNNIPYTWEKKKEKRKKENLAKTYYQYL
jgi:hypothetical protein